MADEPIPAATLIVVRDRKDGPPELLMVERAADMAFAGGALVFPGGRIDEADYALGGPGNAAPVAATRETLEETAVAVGLEPVPSPEQALALQAELAGGHDFARLIARSDLRLAPERLIPFARWVPKFHAVRRFDTHFFVAAAPEGDWHPNSVPGECAGAFWMSAADVLRREKQGEANLIFPTRRNLERLAQHSSFAEIVADARAHPVEPITPWVEERDGEQFITIPGHLGYPVTSEPLRGLWRG